MVKKLSGSNPDQSKRELEDLTLRVKILSKALKDFTLVNKESFLAKDVKSKLKDYRDVQEQNSYWLDSILKKYPKLRDEFGIRDNSKSLNLQDTGQRVLEYLDFIEKQKRNISNLLSRLEV